MDEIFFSRGQGGFVCVFSVHVKIKVLGISYRNFLRRDVNQYHGDFTSHWPMLVILCTKHGSTIIAILGKLKSPKRPPSTHPRAQWTNFLLSTLYIPEVFQRIYHINYFMSVLGTVTQVVLCTCWRCDFCYACKHASAVGNHIRFVTSYRMFCYFWPDTPHTIINELDPGVELREQNSQNLLSCPKS